MDGKYHESRALTTRLSLDLNARIRSLMMSEFNHSYSCEYDYLYYSTFLTARGKDDFPKLLTEAIEKHDSSWLAQQLITGGRLSSTAKSNSHHTFANSEFLKFYVRAVCRAALEDGIENVIYCRVKPSTETRPESNVLIGRPVHAKRLLDELRSSIEQGRPVMGIGNSNSGIAVQLP